MYHLPCVKMRYNRLEIELKCCSEVGGIFILQNVAKKDECLVQYITSIEAGDTGPYRLGKYRDELSSDVAPSRVCVM